MSIGSLLFRGSVVSSFTERLDRRTEDSMHEKLVLLLVLALLAQVGPNTTNRGHSDRANAPSNSAKTNQRRLMERDGRQQQPSTPQPRAVLTGHHGRDCELAFD